MEIWRRSVDGVNERNLPLNTLPLISGVLKKVG